MKKQKEKLSNHEKRHFQSKKSILLKITKFSYRAFGILTNFRKFKYYIRYEYSQLDGNLMISEGEK